MHGSQPLSSQQNSYPIHNFDSAPPEFMKPGMRLTELKAVEELSMNIAKKTSGFTVEQLEQVNATLMGIIWTYRNQWNRDLVIKAVLKALEEVLEDILAMQRTMRGSASLGGSMSESGSGSVASQRSMSAADDLYYH